MRDEVRSFRTFLLLTGTRTVVQSLDALGLPFIDLGRAVWRGHGGLMVQ